MQRGISVSTEKLSDNSWILKNPTIVEFTPAEKIIIRNQRLIMLALNILLLDNPSGSAGYSDKILSRVRQMEANLEWLAAPGERI